MGMGIGIGKSKVTGKGMRRGMSEGVEWGQEVASVGEIGGGRA